MDLLITTKYGNKEYKNIWEVQDNNHNEIVIKNHDHVCDRLPLTSIIKIEIKPGEENG